MLVRDLIEQLQSCNQDDEVVLQVLHGEVTPLTSVTDLRTIIRAYGGSPATLDDLCKLGGVILRHSL